MRPTDTKGRYIKTNSKKNSNIFGRRITPSPVNFGNRYSGNNSPRKNTQEVVEEKLGSSERNIMEQEVQQLGETKSTLVESPIIDFSFLQPIKTSLPDISSLKDGVNSIIITKEELSPLQLPNTPQISTSPLQIHLFKKIQH